ncbi:MAG: hypothetical protein ACXW1D_00060 [Halobacteriota archaeon]
MITFETQKDFEDAVMDVLHQRLGLSISVCMEESDDYYSMENVPKVEVSLFDLAGAQIVSAEDKAY